MLNHLRNSNNNAISRGILGSPKNQQALVHSSSRKRITFDEDEPSSSQQSIGMSYPTAGAQGTSFQSLLFDSNNNPSNNPQANGAAPSFPKEEHDSPRNGVRKDVKLNGDMTETEELFGKCQHLNCLDVIFLPFTIQASWQDLRAVAA